MKKLIALILALTMVLALTACGGEASNPGTKAPEQSSETKPASEKGGTSIGADGSVITNYEAIDDVDPKVKGSLPHYEVLVVYGQFTDKLGSQYKSSIEFICEQLNCTPTFLEAAGFGDEQLSTIQAALVNHFDFCLGIGTTEGILKIFEEAKVPYVSVGTILSDPAQIEAARNYEYFLGCVGVDDYAAMAEGARTLYEPGLPQRYLERPAPGHVWPA